MTDYNSTKRSRNYVICQINNHVPSSALSCGHNVVESYYKSKYGYGRINVYWTKIKLIILLTCSYSCEYEGN